MAAPEHVDIPFGRPMIGQEEIDAVVDVLSSPQLVHGPRAHAFEQTFALMIGNDAHATSVSSCTAGLHLAYLHFGIGEGDEVIVPAATHVATAHAVEITGARPVFVDADTSGNIDIDQIEAAITPRTRAVCVVHFPGLPVDMPQVNEIARRHGLVVVEDCALAVGARIDGVACGLWGDVASFSFYPVKHMTTAEGGMVVSRHADVVSSIANIKAFGYDRSPDARAVPGVYDVARLGINYRMNELAAAIGLVQLDRVPEMQLQRDRNTAALREALAAVPMVRMLPAGDERRRHANYCLVVELTGSAGQRRNDVLSSLKQRGVGTSVYYPVPLPLSRYYRDRYGASDNDFPNARMISDRTIALPVGPHLTELDMRTIADELRRVLASLEQ